VHVLAHRNAKDVPLVLASITANQFYTRGTFRRINDWGNYKAIDCAVGKRFQGDHWEPDLCAVGKRFQGDHWEPDQQGPAQILECLSSVELETLVAKLLEAHG